MYSYARFVGSIAQNSETEKIVKAAMSILRKIYDEYGHFGEVKKGIANFMIGLSRKGDQRRQLHKLAKLVQIEAFLFIQSKNIVEIKGGGLSKDHDSETANRELPADSKSHQRKLLPYPSLAFISASNKTWTETMRSISGEAPPHIKIHRIEEWPPLDHLEIHETTPFFGRKEVVQEIQRNLRPGIIMEIVAMGGIGKSRTIREAILAGETEYLREAKLSGDINKFRQTMKNHLILKHFPDGVIRHEFYEDPSVRNLVHFTIRLAFCLDICYLHATLKLTF